MIVAIVRVVVALESANALKSVDGLDLSWLYTWGSIEHAAGSLPSNSEPPDGLTIRIEQL